MPERFFCEEAAGGGILRLEGAEANHLSRVRRVSVGKTVVLFDGKGFATEAEVREVRRREVLLEAVGAPLPNRSPLIELTLAIAPPKGDRLDWLVEKATEIGVARLVPLVTERSVVDPSEAKLERLRKAVIEASKQCGRNLLMRIEPPIAWDIFLSKEESGVKLLAEPGGLAWSAWPLPSVGGSTCLAVGPEGGFTSSEVTRAEAVGWSVVGLGPTILRVETAGLVGSARLLAVAESPGEQGAS